MPGHESERGIFYSLHKALAAPRCLQVFLMIRVNFLMTFRLMTAHILWRTFCIIALLLASTYSIFPILFFCLFRIPNALNLMLYLIFVIVENNVIHNRVTYNIKEILPHITAIVNSTTIKTLAIVTLQPLIF